MWRRWGSPQHSFLTFIVELEKQLFIKKKKLLKRGNKKSKIVLFTMIGTEIDNFGSFLAFYPLKIKKIRVLKKWKKNLRRISSFYICVKIKIMIIWCTVPKIRCEIGTAFVILGHFLHFYPLKTREIKILKNWKNTCKYHDFTHDVHWKPQSYDIRFLRCEVERTDFFYFGSFFCPFIPLTTQKIKILKKWKRHGDIISLQKCTKNHDLILYFSWDMTRDGCNFYF